MIQHIEYIQFCMKMDIESVAIHDAHKIIHIFRNNQDGMIEEIDDETDEIDQVNVANSWNLPNKEFDGLYERFVCLFILCLF